MSEKITIVGAGLVGSLWAVYLAKKGYKVQIFERRSDMRKTDISAGRSINLALSDRGWKALDGAGIGDEIRKIAIPMSGRKMHAIDGSLTFQKYGKEGQSIYSVSRGALNALMMDIAEKHDGVNIHFDHKCVDVDFESAALTFDHNGQEKIIESDVIFGADGAFSAVRYNMQKTSRFDYQQSWLPHGYKELLLPANEDGSFKMDKNALHIWPRGEYMLIALANLDGSFTCTLFLPFEGEHSFEKLKTEEQVNSFFKKVFPDFYELIPNLNEEFNMNPTSGLATIKCYPWSKNGKVCLLGDAAHAIVPFYGQGMNAGFEDCTILNNLCEKHLSADKAGDDSWATIFEEFQEVRKPSGDAIADLAIRNFVEMRDLVGDEDFLLQKKIEAKIYNKYPEKWIPLYSRVTFSHKPYVKALQEGEKQDAIMQHIMALDNIKQVWDSDEVENKILDLLNS